MTYFTSGLILKQLFLIYHFFILSVYYSEKRAHNFVLVASIFATISGSSDALELAFPEAFEGGEDLEACCSPSLRFSSFISII